MAWVKIRPGISAKHYGGDLGRVVQMVSDQFIVIRVKPRHITAMEKREKEMAARRAAASDKMKAETVLRGAPFRPGVCARSCVLPSQASGIRAAWKEERTESLVILALENGFKAIDTANQRKHYDEIAVGKALKLYLEKMEVSREDLFVQTKFNRQFTVVFIGGNAARCEV